MLYGTLADYCTDQSCPSMTAGPKYKYLWTDGKTKPTDMSAKQYVSRLMEWIASQLEDEKVFPSKVRACVRVARFALAHTCKQMDNPFPKNFQMIVKSVFRRLFRVFAHVYHHHVEHVQALDVTVTALNWGRPYLRAAKGSCHSLTWFALQVQLNTSFQHFMFFVLEFNLIEKKELAPLSELISRIKPKKGK